MFGRKKIDESIPEGRELAAAQKALAEDPVNRGALGTVDENSPAAQRNLAVQQRLNRAEAAYKRAKA